MGHILKPLINFHHSQPIWSLSSPFVDYYCMGRDFSKILISFRGRRVWFAGAWCLILGWFGVQGLFLEVFGNHMVPGWNLQRMCPWLLNHLTDLMNHSFFFFKEKHAKIKDKLLGFGAAIRFKATKYINQLLLQAPFYFPHSADQGDCMHQPWQACISVDQILLGYPHTQSGVSPEHCHVVPTAHWLSILI